MASEEDHIVYNEDDDDDDDEDEPLKDVVLDDDDDAPAGVRFAGDGDSDDSDDTNSTSSAAAVVSAAPRSSSSAAVSIAVLPPSAPAPVNGSDPVLVTAGFASAAIPASAAVVSMASPSTSAVAAAPLGERKLFQKLWTDEDEIELLRGFLEYNTQRGPHWTGHHHDTTAFYDQIKSKLQLDCNKNQLVEKLRRLKKKYRTAVSRISSGRESVFKSPHDQTIFEISCKIWSDSIANRPEFDDDDQNPNSGGTPFVATPHSAGDQRTPASFGIDINSPDNKMMIMSMGTPSRSRKRSRMQVEEKTSKNVNSGVNEPVNPAPISVQGSMEETVKSCLAPLLKEFIDKITVDRSRPDGCGLKGIESLVSNAIPMNFPGVNLGSCGDVMDERWRKQLILELEVYSKRLEIVQDQIKLSLQDLMSRGNCLP